MMKVFFCLQILLLLASCNKEEVYSKESMLKMAQAGDPEVSLILPKSMTEGVHCTNYPDGCVSAHIVKVKNLEMIAVEFTSENEAKTAAKKLRGLYTKNWLLDDVVGEPSLERFFKEHLKAQEP